jgi:hypothetical protein
MIREMSGASRTRSCGRAPTTAAPATSASNTGIPAPTRWFSRRLGSFPHRAAGMVRGVGQVMPTTTSPVPIILPVLVPAVPASSPPSALCPACGDDLPPPGDHCGHCGVMVFRSTRECRADDGRPGVVRLAFAHVPPSACPRCGGERAAILIDLRPGTRCRRCGVVALRPPRPAPPAPARASRDRRRFGVLVVTVVVTVAVVGIGAVLASAGGGA